jgi:hypothetical protein
MTIEADDKRFITLRNGLWVVGVLVAIGLIGGVFLFNRSENAINAIYSEVNGLKTEVNALKTQVEKSLNVFASGDTPVVLLWGSVDLQSKTKMNWQTDPQVPGGYQTSGEHPTGAISIRNFDGSGEFTRVMTNGQPWVVTVVSNSANGITVSQAANDPDIHVAPVSGPLTLPSATMLHYHKRGIECPGGRNDCDTLETVSIMVNNISRGTFTCTNGPPTPSVPNPAGHCRVAFVEK